MDPSPPNPPHEVRRRCELFLHEFSRLNVAGPHPRPQDDLRPESSQNEMTPRPYHQEERAANYITLERERERKTNLYLLKKRARVNAW